MPNTRRWTKNEIVRVLRERLAANESCNVAALRMAGLGALYNAAQKLFAEEYAAVGNNWAGLLRHLLAVNECRRIAARHRWTRETVE